MVRLSLSTDTNTRSQLMAQIRAITSSSLLDISEKIKQILCERARDKIVIFELNNYSTKILLLFSGKYERKHWIILDMFIKRNVLIPIGQTQFKNN